MCLTASQKLHDGMFKGIISTTMRFFDTNPSGRILNRFSENLGLIDDFLNKYILDAIHLNLFIVGPIVVTFIVNPLFIIPIGAISVVLVGIRRVYLKSSKSIKRLEASTKSPVYTHISSTISGLSTVRAFNAETILMDEFSKHQDLHTACWYMYRSTSASFGLSMDILVSIFIFIVIFTFLLFDTGVTGDKVGLAITQSMALTGLLQWGVRQSAETANQLVAVERVLEYRSLEPEKEPEKPLELAPEWPPKGQIEFRGVFYRYANEMQPVLRDLTFTIRPIEKIGIVGRTGAGKSSLIGTLFRLAIVEGEVLIDDIDTSKLRLTDVRSKISIIPQDPFLFSGTLRRFVFRTFPSYG